MAAKVMTSDLYAQFFPVRVNLDGADTSTVVEAEVPTGLSVRGGRAWLIHNISWWFADLHTMMIAGTVFFMDAYLMTRSRLADVPMYEDQGVIDAWHFSAGVTAGGGEAREAVAKSPDRRHFLPPLIVASPRLYLWAQTSSDLAGLRTDPITARLEYTTVELEAATWVEIAETWGAQ